MPMTDFATSSAATHGAPDTWRSTLASRLMADGLVVAVIVIWWLMARQLPAIVLPDPWTVAKAVIGLFADPESLMNIAITAMRVIASVVAATLLGALLAGLGYYAPSLQDIILLRVQPFLGAMPSLGWAILGLIWFGVADFTVIFIQTMILIPFCLINFTQGLRELDAELIEMGHSFTRSRTRIFVKLIVPLMLPYAVASVRLAYGVCWKIALVSELFGAETGVGYIMLQAQNVSDATTVIATCLVIVIMFMAGDYLVLRPLTRTVTR
jgi:NitT/TauT family transport system permease protein/sulfonate transport system permease protein